MMGLNDAGSRELAGDDEGDAAAGGEGDAVDAGEGEAAAAPDGEAEGDGERFRAAASSYATDAVMSESRKLIRACVGLFDVAS